MSERNKLLLQVVERYIFHRDYKTDDTVIKGMAKDMCDIEIMEMWMLTQEWRNKK